MNDKQIAAKAEDLTAKAERGETNSLGAEFHSMTSQEQLAVAKKMDEINAVKPDGAVRQ